MLTFHQASLTLAKMSLKFSNIVFLFLSAHVCFKSFYFKKLLNAVKQEIKGKKFGFSCQLTRSMVTRLIKILATFMASKVRNLKELNRQYCHC